MKKGCTLFAAVVAAALMAAPALLSAQRAAGPAGAPGAGRRGRGPATPAGPTPRLPNGKPDLSGHWQNPYTPDMARPGTVLDPKTRQPLTFARMGEPLPDAEASAINRNAKRTYDLPYTDWGLKQWKEYDPVHKGDYAGSCLPFGMSRNINSPHGLQIVENASSIALLFEQNTWFHWIPIGNDPWPKDLPPAWNGISVAHWDGDTLVVETTGFNGWTRLDTAGHPQSNQLKLINTFLRKDSNTIEHTVTVHDPKTYTQDWMNVRTWRLKPPGDVIMEYSCEENNLDQLFSGAIKRWTPPTDDEN
ncbi:MAG TPA: hypothetical protein VG871_05225 [Vicinamibacterales bacterium]|nr:hypothetical protein [Vicinamibacterales bacterium]